MKFSVLLLSLAFLTSCAHKNWCPAAKENKATATTKTKKVNESQATAEQVIASADTVESTLTVKEIQTKLNILGHKAGPIDGIVGSKTKAALTSFQESAELEITGDINTNTIQTLIISK